MKNILLPTLFAAIAILFIACSEDDPMQDPPIGPSVNKAIGADGGVIEFNDIYINIPVGAFADTRNIEVFELQEESGVFENTTSKHYRLDGLPAVIYEDIHVELKGTNSTESDQIVLEYELYKKGLNQTGLGHRFLPTEKDEQDLLTQIPAFDALSNLTQEDEVRGRSGESHWFNIYAVSLVSNVESKNNNFLIRIPTSYVNEAEYLGDYLEEAYDKFKDMGFDYDKRGKWPVEIIVKKLKNDDRFGAFVGSVYGFDETNIEINVTKLGDKEELKVTAGHEFFHLVQDLYDPRSTWEKVKGESALIGEGAPQIWLDEAMAVWSEKFFTSRSKFTPLLFVENFSSLLAGGFQAYGNKDQKQNYGYSLAPLIEFLHFNYGGDAALVDIYEKIEQKEEGMAIIDDIFSSSLSANWPRIIENVLEFKLYPAQEGTSFDFAAILPGLAQSRLLPATQPIASKVFDFSLPDLSGKTFYIKNNQFTGFDPNAVLAFEVLNEADVVIQVYRTNADEKVSEKIAEGTEKIVINDFKEQINEGYKIGAVVINKGRDIPYTQNAENVSLKISIVQPFEINFVENWLEFDGIARVNRIEYGSPNWDTTYSSSITALSARPLSWTEDVEYQTILVGDSYITTATGNNTDGLSSSPLSYIDYTFSSTFDDPIDPKKIISFEFEMLAIDSSIFGGTGTVEKWSTHYKVSNIPFLNFDPIRDVYMFRGNIERQQIEFASHVHEWKYYQDGDIVISEKEELQSFTGGTATVLYHIP